MDEDDTFTNEEKMHFCKGFIKPLQQKIVELTQEIEVLKASSSESERLKLSMRARLLKLSSDNAELKNAIAQASGTIKTQLDGIEGVDDEVMKENRNLGIQKSDLQRSNNGLNAQVLKRDKQIADYADRNRRLAEQNFELKKDSALVVELKRQNEELAHRVQQLESKLTPSKTVLKGQNEELAQQVQQLGNLNNKATNKLKQLKERHKAFKGGKSTSPSNIIYKGKKAIRQRFFMTNEEKVAELGLEQQRAALRKAKEEEIKTARNIAFPNGYYSTSPVIKRFMRKINHKAPFSAGKLNREAFRRKLRENDWDAVNHRFELTPSGLP